jgi:peptide/nickel transport system substrate-binding protein
MKPRFRKLGIVAVAFALIVTGCSSKDKPESSGGGTTSSTQAKPAASSVLRIKDKGVTAKGGTVYVLQDGDFTSLDPANNYRTESEDVGRLIYRSLTFAKDTPGEDLSIQPDLAESLGTSSDGGRTWTYRLREGLKYEDGVPITAQDVKYGVMRSFESDMFTDGATWMPDLLVNETGFKGPYATPDKDLTSVETPDDRTLIFHFSGPQPDADWIMSMPYTVPVPKDKDTKQDYGNRPVSSGPYKIETYDHSTLLTLVRNENWDPATDPNRPAYPDRFQVELNAEAPAARERLLKGNGNDTFAVPLGTWLSADDSAKAEDPALQARFVNGPGPCVEYLTMNTQKLKDPNVRHAIALAIDRQGIQKIGGGELFGTKVDSVIPAAIPGYVAPDLGLKPAGDPDAAKKLLEGKTVPPLHFAVEDPLIDSSKKEIDQIQANLKTIGLEMIVETRPSEELTELIDGPGAPELSWGAWCFDWPTAGSIVLPLLGPNSDGTSWGSKNTAKYYDPKFSDQLQALRSSSDESAAIAKKFVDIANEIQTTAWPYLPTRQQNDPVLVGANLTNVGISPMWSEVDLNTIAVKK